MERNERQGASYVAKPFLGSENKTNQKELFTLAIQTKTQ